MIKRMHGKKTRNQEGGNIFSQHFELQVVNISIALLKQ